MDFEYDLFVTRMNMLRHSKETNFENIKWVSVFNIILRGIVFNKDLFFTLVEDCKGKLSTKLLEFINGLTEVVDQHQNNMSENSDFYLIRAIIKYLGMTDLQGNGEMRDTEICMFLLRTISSGHFDLTRSINETYVAKILSIVNNYIIDDDAYDILIEENERINFYQKEFNLPFTAFMHCICEEYFKVLEYIVNIASKQKLKCLESTGVLLMVEYSACMVMDKYINNINILIKNDKANSKIYKKYCSLAYNNMETLCAKINTLNIKHSNTRLDNVKINYFSNDLLK